MDKTTNQSTNKSTLFSWEFIWSTFIRAPRVRDWLFWSEAPMRTHVIKSLINNPMLCGFIFKAFDELQYYEFPDIGDLETIFAIEGDTMLGFSFGFEGINPAVPIMYCFQNDAYLADPLVKVRRTARRFVRFSNFSCYFHIEFCWMMSGILIVKTSVQAYCETIRTGSHVRGFIPGAVMDEVEIRVFSPEDTLSLVQIVTNLYSYEQFTRKRRLTSGGNEFFSLPAELIVPRWSYIARIREPNDKFYGHNLNTQRELHSNDTSLGITGQPMSKSGFSTLNRCNEPEDDCLSSISVVTNNAKDNNVDDVNSKIINMWTRCCNSMETARLVGTYRTNFYKSLEKRMGNNVPGVLEAVGLGEQDSNYTFLCRTGISVRRRIHQLCTLLRIDYAQPQTDRILYKYISAPRTMVPQDVRLSPAIPSTTVNHEPVVNTHLDVGTEAKEGVDSIQTNEGDDLSRCCVNDDRWSPIGVPDFNADEAEFSCLSSLSRSDNNSDNKKTRRNDELPGNLEPTSFKTSSNYIPVNDDTYNYNYDGDAFVHVSPARVPQHISTSNRQDNGGSDIQQRQQEYASIEGGVKMYQYSNVNEFTSKVQQRTTAPNIQDQMNRIADTDSKNACNANFDDDEEEEEEEEEEEGEQERQPDADTFGGRRICTPGGHEEWECGKCGIRIQGKRGNLKRHVEYKHLNIRRFTCSISNCGRKFHSRPNLKRHQITVHAGRPYQCNQCPRNFKQQSDLSVHVKTSHVDCDEKMACDVCGGCFGYRSSLNRHRRTVHGKKDDGVITNSQP